MSNIIRFDGPVDESDEVEDMINALREDTKNMFALCERDDGEAYFVTNIKTKKDLVFFIYTMQKLAQDLVTNDLEYDE